VCVLSVTESGWGSKPLEVEHEQKRKENNIVNHKSFQSVTFVLCTNTGAQ